MTVHVISVGISILKSLGDPRSSLTGKPELIRAVLREKPHEILADAGAAADHEKASGWLASVTAPAGDPLHDPRLARQFADAAGAVSPGQWPLDISAEVQTFDRVRDTRLPLASHDVAVLICSDTPQGILAGAWNAVVLAGGDLARIAYLPEPTVLPGPVLGRVLVTRVPGLDAGDEPGFRQAMGGLGVLGRHLLDARDVPASDPVRFYLSGGYKAAIPYLIGLAEAMRSRGGDRPVDAFVLHEEADTNAPPIRLPLRRVIPEQVARELSGFDSSGTRQGVKQPALLEGYAYHISGTTCTLTAFGAGLHALFDLPDEPLGP